MKSDEQGILEFDPRPIHHLTYDAGPAWRTNVRHSPTPQIVENLTCVFSPTQLDELKMVEVYLDGSVLEVFSDIGRCAFATRFYDGDEKSKAMSRIVTLKGAVGVDLGVYGMSSAFTEYHQPSRRKTDDELIKFAAISIVASKDAGVKIALGEVTKQPALFGHEHGHHIDNGYPSVAAPLAEGEPWRLWYNSFSTQSDKSKPTATLLYANSSDGVTWEKPQLSLVHGVSNGVFSGEGIGIYQDPDDIPARRFKAFGQFCTDSSEKVTGNSCVRSSMLQGIAVSADGLHFVHASNTSWPFPVGHGVGDCHDNLFFDKRKQRWLATTRVTQNFTPRQSNLGGPVLCQYSHTSTPAPNYCCGSQENCDGGRLVGILSSPGTTFQFDASTKAVTTLPGTPARQLYSQITFPWHNIYLGIVMVIDQCDLMENGTYDCRADQFGRGKVHCRLVYASDPLASGTRCNMSLGPRGCYAHGLHHPCHECVSRPSATGWRYVDAGGLTGRDFIPLGEISNDPSKNEFDSHICFAAQHPVTVGNEERIYFMGGNGPHSGVRNTSFGLATTRRDGFAALVGIGIVTTVPIPCFGKRLTVTVDFDVKSTTKPFLKVGCPSCADIASSLAINKNSTDTVVNFASGGDFSAYVHKKVVLRLWLCSARVYTLGWK
eukprot:SAG31_NODE_1832_length_7148_cov_5.322315_2_plen_659_part_00